MRVGAERPELVSLDAMITLVGLELWPSAINSEAGKGELAREDWKKRKLPYVVGMGKERVYGK